MKVIRIISEWKKRSSGVNPLKDASQKRVSISSGQKMVQAIIEIDGERFTRHIAVSR